MTKAQIGETVAAFAEGARRAREAGLDGVELHAAPTVSITQFLSSAINDRKDEYGGRSKIARASCSTSSVPSREGWSRLSSADEDQRPGIRRCDRVSGDGTVRKYLAESVQVCKWLVEAGVDAIMLHGSFFRIPESCGRRSARRGSRQELRHDDLERRADFREFPALQRRGYLARNRWNEAAESHRTRSKARTCRTRARSRRRSTCR